jgi:hypothetical protein
MRTVGKTAMGAATAGYPGVVGKGFNRLHLAVPATRGGENAEIRMYDTVSVESSHSGG